MTNMVLLVVCFLTGMILRRTGRFPEATPAALNGFVIYLSLPALALLHLHRIEMQPALLLTAGMAWCLFGMGFLFFLQAGKLLRLDKETTGALILVGGLGNTSFVGLPMIEAYYGKEWLGVGLVADLLGSFLVLSTLGILAATVYSTGEVSVRQVIRKVLLFPPFQAVVLALLLRPLPFSPVVETVLQRLGDTLTPLALVSVGFQLRLSHLRGKVPALGLGLFYKLALGPALIALLYAGIMRGEGPTLQVTLFEAAMAPMISAGIVAVDHDLDPPLVTIMLGIGIPLSFLTLPVWFWLLRGV
jgi:malate permease and related proteins